MRRCKRIALAIANALAVFGVLPALIILRIALEQ